MSTPAGWYPDPDDASSLRFWDGEQWTTGTASGTTRAEAGPAATYWQRYLSRWKYTFLVVAVLAFVGQVLHPTVQSADNWISLVVFAAAGGAIWATILTLLIALFRSSRRVP